MHEVARVLKVEKRMLEVKTFSGGSDSTCSSCALNTVCGSKKIHVTNPKGYDIKIGDMVEIDIPERVSVSALSGLLYGIPVIIILAVSMMLRYGLGLGDYLSLGISGGIVGFYYWFLNGYSKRNSARFSPSVVKKISKVIMQ